jgi:hypothetical protein
VWLVTKGEGESTLVPHTTYDHYLRYIKNNHLIKPMNGALKRNHAPGFGGPFKYHSYAAVHAVLPSPLSTSPWHGMMHSICHSATRFASRRMSE